MVVGFDTAEFELLDDVADLLESVRVVVALCIVVRDDQESGSLEQYDFVRVDSLAELHQILLQSLHVREQEVHYLGPGFVESLVPNGSLEAVHLEALGPLLDLGALLLEHLLPLVLCQQVHFVNQAKDLCLLRQVIESVEAVLVVREIACEVLAGHVEHVNQHFYVLENVLPLTLEVLLHEQVLSSAIPQTQY